MEANELNESGIIPLDLVMLVYPDPPKEKTAGGIFIPETVQAKEKYHTVKATLIQSGKSCFADWVEKPQDGSRVLIVQYAGSLIEGKDGKEYRIIRNEDLIAILEGE